MSQESTCREELLTLYHYGELDAAQLQEVEAHLAACAACRTELEDLQRTLAVIPRPQFTLSAAQRSAFTDRVMARRRRRPLLATGAWSGALGVAALAIYLLILHPGAPAPPVTTSPALVDIEVLEQLEMLQDFDLLQNLDLLQELEGAG